MTDPNSDLWVDVLAGRKAPVDRATRQADGIRRYFEREMAADAQPLHDQQRTKRLLNLLEAEGLLKPRDEAAPQRRGLLAPTSARRPGPVAAVLAWLFPEGGGVARLGWAAAAGLAAVLVIPLIVRQTPQADEHLQSRGLPASGAASTAAPAASLPANATVVPLAVADPVSEAAKAQQALALAGFEPRMNRDATSAWVDLTVAPDKLAAARQALAPWSAVITSGEIRLQFVPAKR